MGITEVLTIVFIVLKLLNVIEWNWFLVLLPEIIAIIFYVIIFIIWIIQFRSINKEFKNMKENIKNNF